MNLTELFGIGNEPSEEQMEEILSQFPDSWFDETKNLFNAKHFMKLYFKKMTELENAITTLGGSV